MLFAESQCRVLGKTDLLICLGGDGTLLYAASLFEVYTHVLMCVCVCMYCVHVCVWVCGRGYCICVCVCVCVHMCVYMYCVHVWVWVCGCGYCMCECVCVCVWCAHAVFITTYCFPFHTHPQNTVPPIVSLAMGSLGFLTSFFADSYQETIDRVLKSERCLTQCCV